MKKKSFIARSAAILLGITLGFGTLPVGAFKSKPLKAAEVTDITGSTTVETVGDINGDGEINAKDVTMLRRYLAQGWGVTVNEEDADINGDNEVNAKDVTMLRRYLAKGWGVELPEKDNDIVDGYWISNNKSESFVFLEKDNDGNNVKKIFLNLDGSIAKINNYSSGKLISTDYGDYQCLYDINGNVIKIIEPDEEDLFEYDDMNNATKIVITGSQREGIIEHAYDSEGNRVSEVSYYSYKDGTKEIVEEYYEIEKYDEPDEYGRTSIAVLSKAIVERSDGSKAEYDKNAGKTIILNTDGTVTTYQNEYTSDGKPVKDYKFNYAWVPSSGTLSEGIMSYEYKYDDYGRVIDECQDHCYGRSYEYDLEGRKIKQTSYTIDGGQPFVTDFECFEYDEAGNIIHEYTSSEDNTFVYNGLGQITESVRKYTWSNTVSRSLYVYNTKGELIKRTDYRDDALFSEIEFIDGRVSKETKVEELFLDEYYKIIYYYDENGVVVKSDIITPSGSVYESELVKDELGRIVQLPYEAVDDIEGMGRSSGHLNLKYVDDSNMRTMFVWRQDGEPENPDKYWREEYVFDLKNRTYTYCNNGIADWGKLVYYELIYDKDWNVVEKKEKLYTKKEGGYAEYFEKELLAEMTWSYDSEGNEQTFCVNGYNGIEYEYDLSDGQHTVQTENLGQDCICVVSEKYDPEKQKKVIANHYISGEYEATEYFLGSEEGFKPVKLTYSDWNGNESIYNYVYDAEGLLIEEPDSKHSNTYITFESEGKEVKKIEKMIDFGGIYISTTLYNEDGSRNVVSTSTYGISGGVHEVDIDKNGNEIRIKNIKPDGSSEESFYDEEGFEIKEIRIEADGTIYEYSY